MSHTLIPPQKNLVFPKYEASDEQVSEIVAGMSGVVNFSKEEIEADDRLKYIVSR